MDFDTLLARFARAVAAHDSAGFAALFTADGAYEDGFFGRHQGRQAIAAMLDRFHVGGEQFHWQWLEALSGGDLGYARYCFSYRSRDPEIAGRLIVFEGMARFRLAQGLIADYAEVFDRGVAFVQLGYAVPRIHKLLTRHSEAFCNGEMVATHLAQRSER